VTPPEPGRRPRPEERPRRPGREEHPEQRRTARRPEVPDEERRQQRADQHGRQVGEGALQDQRTQVSVAQHEPQPFQDLGPQVPCGIITNHRPRFGLAHPHQEQR
jgi:hypothetical protein